jgi:tripartite ATP-independent transporter DctP family solute receptor
MKKILGLILALTLVASFAYAAGGGEAGGKQEATLKLAHSYQPTHAFSAGSKKIAEVAREKSGGKLIINEFPAGQLGSEKDITDGCVNGIIDIVISGTGEIGKRYTPILIFEGGFLLSGYDHAQRVLKSDIGREMWEGCLKATGLRSLTTLYYGTRHVTSNKEIHSPADMKGMKLRAPDMPMSVANATAMGANPTPMALSEVYLALQQNVVDGQENPIPTIYTQKFYEVQKYIILTGHTFQLTPVFINDKIYQGLSPELQKVVTGSVAEVAPTIDQAIMADEKKMLDEMQSRGMTVINPDVNAFVKATAVVYTDPKLQSNWGPDLYNKIQALR